jgi:hypothetical protein
MAEVPEVPEALDLPEVPESPEVSVPVWTAGSVVAMSLV